MKENSCIVTNKKAFCEFSHIKPKTNKNMGRGAATIMPSFLLLSKQDDHDHILIKGLHSLLEVLHFKNQADCTKCLLVHTLVHGFIIVR